MRIFRLTLFAALLAAAGLAGAPPAFAQAGRNCDAIKDAHAFNLCLASQGPRRGVRAAPPPGAAPARPSARRGGARVQRSGPRLRGGITISRTSSGRVRMVIPARRR
ncbi:MAG: hypothetical protein FJX29_04305 [Alphaproteobacteria bacterium]|nr:hypothetical protein [Alphaproteobacteria bacterium]